MSHIHTEPGQHDHITSAYIIRTDLEEPQILLHRHKQLGVWLQFGGHIELDENPWQAIIHELREESGYDIDQLTVLQPADVLGALSASVSHPTPLSHNTHVHGNSGSHIHIDTSYGFIVDQAPHHPIDEGESKTLRLFTRQELNDLSATDIYTNTREIALFLFDVALKKWERRPAGEVPR
jgi:8-oxo-dGTP diphosphatase